MVRVQCTSRTVSRVGHVDKWRFSVVPEDGDNASTAADDISAPLLLAFIPPQQAMAEFEHSRTLGESFIPGGCVFIHLGSPLVYLSVDKADAMLITAHDYLQQGQYLDILIAHECLSDIPRQNLLRADGYRAAFAASVDVLTQLKQIPINQIYTIMASKTQQAIQAAKKVNDATKESIIAFADTTATRVVQLTREMNANWRDHQKLLDRIKSLEQGHTSGQNDDTQNYDNTDAVHFAPVTGASVNVTMSECKWPFTIDPDRDVIVSIERDDLSEPACVYWTGAFFRLSHAARIDYKGQHVYVAPNTMLYPGIVWRGKTTDECSFIGEYRNAHIEDVVALSLTDILDGVFPPSDKREDLYLGLKGQHLNEATNIHFVARGCNLRMYHPGRWWGMQWQNDVGLIAWYEHSQSWHAPYKTQIFNADKNNVDYVSHVSIIGGTASENVPTSTGYYSASYGSSNIAYTSHSSFFTPNALPVKTNNSSNGNPGYRGACPGFTVCTESSTSIIDPTFTDRLVPKTKNVSQGYTSARDQQFTGLGDGTLHSTLEAVVNSAGTTADLIAKLSNTL